MVCAPAGDGEGPKMNVLRAPQPIVIRDLESFEDLCQVKAVEKEVWGMADDDSLPVTMAVACKAAGCIFVGAFESASTVGHAPIPAAIPDSANDGAGRSDGAD